MRQPSRTLSLFALVALSCLPSLAAQADDYPTKPVKWVVAYPPGGTTDVLARLIGQWLTEHMGQQFVIENKPGGGNNIGTEYVVNAPPTATRCCSSIRRTASTRRSTRTCSFNFLRDIAPWPASCARRT